MSFAGNPVIRPGRGNFSRPDLRKELTDPCRIEQRVAVVWALGELGDPCAVEKLCEVLQDPNEIVRVASAWALGEIAAASSNSSVTCRLLPALLTALEDTSENVRVAAAGALGKARQHAAIVGLIAAAMTDEDADVCREAIWAAQKILITGLQEE